MLMRYEIDLLNDQRINGWIFSRLPKSKPVRLRVFLGRRCVGEVVADGYREDLQAQMLHPSGLCGFELSFPEKLDLTEAEYLTVRADAWPGDLARFQTKYIPQVFSGDIPAIFFMHIPKTAGTSFNAFAQCRYPADSARIHIEGSDPALYPEFASASLYLAGHLRLQSILDHFDLDRFQLYTIIREPYGQLQSHLNWLRAVGHNPDSGFFRKHPACVRDVSKVFNSNSIPVAKKLCSLVAGLDGFLIDYFDNCQTRYFLDYRPDRVGWLDLQNAIKNFHYFQAIGTTERYRNFIAEFSTRYRQPFIAQQKQLNRAKYDTFYNPEDLWNKAIVHPLVKYDLLLYKAVMSRLTAAR